MFKRQYIKESPIHSLKHPIHGPLAYAFVAVNAVAAAFFIVFFNPLNILHLSPVVKQTPPEVQGVSDQVVVSPFPTLQLTAAPTQIPTPTPYSLKKKSYRIAVFGDSMEDTMGELMEYLDAALKKKYPETTFALYNYGIGSQNVEMGLNRWGSEFAYQTRHYPPISTIHADYIILGSFAYNPFYPHDRDKHWLTLTHLVEEAQKTGAKVYLLAEIAPLLNGFGDGPKGVNWPASMSREHATHIVELLENTVGLSRSLHVPLIDVFNISIKGPGKSGDIKYVNTSDHIHPSPEGHTFTASRIVDTLEIK